MYPAPFQSWTELRQRPLRTNRRPPNAASPRRATPAATKGQTGVLGAGTSAEVFGKPVAALTDTDVVTNWPLVVFKAVRLTTPLQPVPKLTVVLMLPLESVVPLAGLKLTVQLAPPPWAEKLTELPGPPGLVKVAVSVTLPPAVTVAEEVETLEPGLI